MDISSQSEDHLDFPIESEIVYLKLNSHGYRDSSIQWRKVSEFLVEMKLFRNYQEHAQTCLRTKHVHLTCKYELANVDSGRHNNLTCVGVKERRCVFAEVCFL